MRLKVNAVSNASCVHTATPQTLVYTVNATNCVDSKTLTLKEIGDGRGVRSLLAGLTNFIVIELFAFMSLAVPSDWYCAKCKSICKIEFMSLAVPSDWYCAKCKSICTYKQ